MLFKKKNKSNLKLTSKNKNCVHKNLLNFEFLKILNSYSNFYIFLIKLLIFYDKLLLFMIIQLSSNLLI